MIAFFFGHEEILCLMLKIKYGYYEVDNSLVDKQSMIMIRKFNFSFKKVDMSLNVGANNLAK